jgi:D-arabinose 1-dehydrogenase-like Zn-dependent alcohol dehydrogenase
MQAVRLVGVRRAAQIEEVPKSSADPGQVLINIGGAGVCHSDLQAGDVYSKLKAGHISVLAVPIPTGTPA